jgi:NAD(P)-dependent dehydrogenase (short-subunit alcohol dehydrogenase family)
MPPTTLSTTTEDEVPFLSAPSFAQLAKRAFDHTVRIAEQCNLRVHDIFYGGCAKLGLATTYPVHEPTAERPLAVLVTGTSSGIGRAIALALAQQGYTVLASVRQTVHGEALVRDFETIRATSSNPIHGSIHPVTIHLAGEESVAQGWKQVEEKLRQLDIPLIALINNAGFLALRIAEWLTAKDWHDALWSNFLGAVELTRYAAPYLRASHGRVINIGSIAEFMTPPCYAAYSASKAALGAWSRSLRIELASFQISVSTIKPGVIITPGLQKAQQSVVHHQIQLREATSQEPTLPTSTDPSTPIYHHITQSLRGLFEFGVDGGVEVDHVVDMVQHALRSATPQPTYYVGLDARALAAAVWLLGESRVDRITAQVVKYFAT